MLISLCIRFLCIIHIYCGVYSIVGFYTTVSLHNETMYKTNSMFMVCLFAEFKHELPVCNAGDILRITNVKVKYETCRIISR